MSWGIATSPAGVETSLRVSCPRILDAGARARKGEEHCELAFEMLRVEFARTHPDELGPHLVGLTNFVQWQGGIPERSESSARQVSWATLVVCRTLVAPLDKYMKSPLDKCMNQYTCAHGQFTR